MLSLPLSLTLPLISFELVPRAQTQNGVLAGLRETKCAADGDMEMIIEFGFEIYARILLGFVWIGVNPRSASPTPP